MRRPSEHGARSAPRARGQTGIDTGGTFTDFIVRRGGRVFVHKVLSTPDDPARAVLAGLAALFSNGPAGRITYGSTVATNALLQRRGARVSLVATAGFEDVVEIGRQARPELYTLEPRRPAALVARADRIPVRERVEFDGRISVALTTRELRALVRRVRARRPEAIAVALLHAYATPRHERAIGAALRVLGVPISLSHVLVREPREYERTSTTVINAYVAPLMTRHLTRLAAVKRGGTRLLVMQSNGGAVAPRRAAAEPMRTVLSGPAGGVVGAVGIARRAGVRRVLTLDMGGTSTDVALVDGDVPRRSEWELDGMAVRLPVVDIHTVGAGGGSLARVDAGGVLRVGPESAGADPGPACYGRGTRATVTDANLVLGRLDPASFLGGRMRLDVRRAHDAVAEVARRLGVDVDTAAEGIVRVANAAMARALRVISVERGHDPRRFALLAFGGAAGVHACELAAELGMREVLVPRHPGLLSAFGMATAPIARDRVVTVRAIDPEPAALARRLETLAAGVRAELRADGVGDGHLLASGFARIRYVGQSHEIEIPLTPDYRRRFDAAHARLYGHASPTRPVEVLGLRVTVSERDVVSRPRRPARRRAAPPPHALEDVVWHRRRVRVARYARDLLPPGTVLRGPALLLEYSSTILVAPGWRAVVDAESNLRLTR
ncbi:MAG: hydantoinase/oxoprolinase family protein [Deltaproteobacteria bacterium]|nr:MAG: hydantoinase/oxoprolinase family protein [Deltaproteobacteria bacterium]